MLLVREVFGDTYTHGRLHIDGKAMFYTLEDKRREVIGRPVADWKVPGVTAIPAGRYEVVITMSPRFKRRLPLLLNVPGFTGVRIHAGNTEHDTEGCILLGTRRAEKSVLNSRAAMQAFTEILEAKLKDGKVWLQIV